MGRGLEETFRYFLRLATITTNCHIGSILRQQLRLFLITRKVLHVDLQIIKKKLIYRSATIELNYVIHDNSGVQKGRRFIVCFVRTIVEF